MQHHSRIGPHGGRIEVYLDERSENVLKGLKDVYQTTLGLSQVSLSALVRRSLDLMLDHVEGLNPEGMNQEAREFNAYRVARPAAAAPGK